MFIPANFCNFPAEVPIYCPVKVIAAKLIVALNLNYLYGCYAISFCILRKNAAGHLCCRNNVDQRDIKRSAAKVIYNRSLCILNILSIRKRSCTRFCQKPDILESGQMTSLQSISFLPIIKICRDSNYSAGKLRLELVLYLPLKLLQNFR